MYGERLINFIDSDNSNPETLLLLTIQDETSTLEEKKLLLISLLQSYPNYLIRDYTLSSFIQLYLKVQNIFMDNLLSDDGDYAYSFVTGEEISDPVSGFKSFKECINAVPNIDLYIITKHIDEEKYIDVLLNDKGEILDIDGYIDNETEEIQIECLSFLSYLENVN